MEKTSSGAFRKKKVYFTQVSNSALRDNTLSLKSKGLYSLIQSFLTIEDFTLYKNNLKKYCAEGEKAFESTWKELKDAGYLIQYRLQGDKGYFYYEYELLDEKNLELADKVHGSQNRKTKNEKNHTPKMAGMDENKKTIPAEMEDMDNGQHGKVGGYNNTDSSNTDLTNTDNLLVVEEVVTMFEDNICKLGKITRVQFEEYCMTYDVDFIKAIIKLCAGAGTKYFSGFKAIIDGYIGKSILTKESLEAYVAEYRAMRKKANENKNKQIKIKSEYKDGKTDTFNSFPQRKYNFDDLEKKLLG